MLHAYTHQSDKKVTFWFGKEGDAIFPLQTLYDNRAEATSGASLSKASFEASGNL